MDVKKTTPLNMALCVGSSVFEEDFADGFFAIGIGWEG